MSYRVCVNDTQIFGNDECYEKWIDFIKSQGITVNEEGEYNGEIKDFMGALSVIEDITMDAVKSMKERNERLRNKGYKGELTDIFDLRYIPKELEKEQQVEDYDDFGTSLTDKILDAIDNNIAFLPYLLIKACRDEIEPCDSGDTKHHLRCFKIRDGAKITSYAR